MSAVDRFRLVRAGILNLYEYTDQVFDLAGGRLLLRGHNTSGKTKALELLLPFCLDGDISPRKLDPFAKAAKDMRWNLVGCIDGRQRTGYAWLEFERLSSEGTERVTAGVGMKATADARGVQRWYFVVRGRRIGEDLSLRRGDDPLTRAELAAELGDESPLIATATDYRRALNEAVFGFPGDDGYQTMLTLMLELRRPHLSKSLDPAAVTRLLSAALPEVDHDLIRRLGDGLEQLEEMRRVLERLRRAHRRLERFVADAYSAYARAVLRERGDALRRGETEYENAARAQREAVAAASEAKARAAEVATALCGAQEAADRAEGALHALLQSPEWRSVEAVEQLGRRAEDQRGAAQSAREHADRAAGDLVIAEAEVARSDGDLEVAQSEVADARERLRLAAEASGFAARHAALDDQLENGVADLDLWRGLAADELTSWRSALADQERLLAELEKAERAIEHARAIEEALGLRVREGRKRMADARADLEAEQRMVEDAVQAWSRGLRELQLDSDALARVAGAALDAGRPEAPSPRDVWRRDSEQRLGEILDAQAAANAARQRVEERLANVRDDLAELDFAHDPGPVPLLTRPADRGARKGAPLWRAVEFAPGLGAPEQAALEAALEAAGLLDAWVTPDGSLLDPDTLDAVLVSGPEQAERTLADVLRLGRGAPAALAATLASVALVDDAPAAGSAAVDLAGGYALGPLRGRYAKAQAEHIGASARAAARARRQAALEAELADAEGELEGVVEALAGLAARRERLAAEEAGFPRLDAIATANRAVLVAERHADELTAEHAEAAQAVRATAGRVGQARAASEAHAHEVGLPALLDVRELRARGEAATRYDESLDPLARAWLRASALEQRVVRERARVDELRERAEALDRSAHSEAAEARRLVAEHAEREGALGAGATELRVRREAVDTELSRAREDVGRLQDADKNAGIAVAQTAGEVTRAAERERAARLAREGALAAFARLERVDVFRLALGGDAPEDHRHAAEWTLTRALEVLRAIPAACLVKDPSDRLATTLTRACSELDRDLAQEAEMSVFTTLDADGVLAVRVRDGAAERSLSGLKERLVGEIAERERTLTAEQRRVFGEALLEEIAAHLRGRIHEVETRVEDMNAILRRSATAAGKVVQLGWRLADDTETAQAIPLIRKPASALGERERDSLVAFFRGRIEQARPAETSAEAGESVVDTLRDAFDYRGWFTFDLWEGIGRERQRLTAKRHALGSGGEQAVLVHLPLFAAAASLYSGVPQAPRLVMLDEALSGIDDDTRTRVMGALVELDLDFVMTSHELWGTYHTVPSLAIYQLYREQGHFGVHCERFLWDGALLREEEQGELFRT